MLKQTLQREHFDLVLDAQGLIKSAWMTHWLPCLKIGLSKDSIRESLASYVYNQTFAVSKKNHAIERTRELCSKALAYPLPTSKPSFSLKLPQRTFNQAHEKKPFVLLLHGTQWLSKV